MKRLVNDTIRISFEEFACNIAIWNGHVADERCTIEKFNNGDP